MEGEGMSHTPTCFHVLGFPAGITLHVVPCTWSLEPWWQLLLCKVRQLLCSEAPLALHSVPLASFPQPCEVQWGALWAAFYSRLSLGQW